MPEQSHPHLRRPLFLLSTVCCVLTDIGHCTAGWCGTHHPLSSSSSNVKLVILEDCPLSMVPETIKSRCRAEGTKHTHGTHKPPNTEQNLCDIFA